MKFFLKRVEDGKFVAKSGSKSSYTKDVLSARIFTKEEVDREKCGNEIAIPVREALGGEV